VIYNYDGSMTITVFTYSSDGTYSSSTSRYTSSAAIYTYNTDGTPSAMYYYKTNGSYYIY